MTCHDSTRASPHTHRPIALAQHTNAVARSLIIGALFSSLVAASSVAWERETRVDMPVVRDLPRSFSIADNAVTDILGLDVGMKAEEAIAILSRLVGKARCCSGLTQQISHDLGNIRVSTRYHQRSEMPFDVDGTSNNVTIVFTPPLIGSRVVAVSRRAGLSRQNVPFAELETAIVGKYGLPSLRFRQRQTLNHVWAYGPEGRIDLSQIAPDQLNRLLTGRILTTDTAALRCISSIENVDIHYGGVSYTTREIDDAYQGCNVVLMISVLESSIPGRAENARYLLVDYRRRYEEKRAVKDFLDAEMRKALAAERPIVPRQ